MCCSDRLESLQALQHSSALEKTWCSRLAPAPIIPDVPLFWAVYGGFPTVLVMCAAGDGGRATLILLPSSGKYPASLCRAKTTKSWVWLQPPGFSAPTRTCPRVTACCFLLPIYPCVTPLLSRAFFFFFSILPPFQPMKDTYDCRRQCNIRPPRTGDRGLWKVKTEDSLNVTKEPKNVVKVGFMEGKKNDSRWCYVIPCDHVITVKKYNPGRKRTGNVGAKCKIKQL